MLIPAIVLGAVFLGVFLLSIPVDLAFSCESGEGSRSRMRIRLLFGLISKEQGGEKKNREKKPKQMIAKKRRWSFRRPLAVFRARGFSGRLLLLARRLIRSVHLRDVDVELQLGTGDPAETGLLFGIILPSLGLTRSGFSPDICIEPNFVEETFEGHARVAVRVYPIKLIPPLIAFALPPATHRGLEL